MTAKVAVLKLSIPTEQARVALRGLAKDYVQTAREMQRAGERVTSLRTLQQTAVDAGSRLDGLRAKARELGQEMAGLTRAGDLARSISDLERMREGLAKAAGDAQRARQRLQELRQADNGSRSMRARIRSAANKAEATETSWWKRAQDVGALERSLSGAGVDITDLAGEQRRLIGDAQRLDLLTAEYAHLSREIRSTGTEAKSATDKAANLSATLRKAGVDTASLTAEQKRLEGALKAASAAAAAEQARVRPRRRLAHAEDVLGVTPDRDIEQQIAALEAAYNRVRDSGKRSAAEVAEYYDRTQQKIQKLRESTSAWTQDQKKAAEAAKLVDDAQARALLNAQRSRQQRTRPFEVIGVRDDRSLQVEIAALEAALKRLRESGRATSAELVRAEVAVKRRVAALRVQMGDKVMTARFRLQVDNQAQARAQIEEVKASLRTLAMSGRASFAEIATAARNARTQIQALRRDAEGPLTRARSLPGGLAGGLIGIGGAYGAASTFGKSVRATDEYASMTGQIKLVTDSSAELDDTMQKLYRTAQDTRTEFGANVDLFSRLTRATDELGYSSTALLTVTRLTNQAAKIGGGSTQAQSAALEQFGQALQSGILQGDELRSIREQAPRLFDAIVTGTQKVNPALGITKANFKELASEGKITSRLIVEGLLTQADTLETEFSQLPRTVGQALTQLENAVIQSVGRSDMSPLIEAIDDLKDKFEDPEFQQSIISIAEAFATLVGVVGQGAAKFVEFGQGLGIWAAEKFSGAKSIDSQVDSIRDRIRMLEDARRLQENSEINPDLSGYDKQLIAAKATLAQLERIQKEINGLAPGTTAKGSSSRNGTTPPYVPVNGASVDTGDIRAASQAQIAIVKALSSAATSELEARLKEGLITLQQYTAERSKLIASSFDAEISARQRESAALGETIAQLKAQNTSQTTKQASNVADRKTGVDAEIKTLQVERKAALDANAIDAKQMERDLAAFRRQLNIQTLQAQGKDTEAALAELDANYQEWLRKAGKDTEATDLASKLFNASKAQIELQKLLTAVQRAQDKYEGARDDITAGRVTGAIGSETEGRGKLRAAKDEYQKTLAEIRAEWEKTRTSGTFSAQQIEGFDRALSTAAGKLKAYDSPLRSMLRDWGSQFDNLERASVGWANNALDALTQFLTTGKADFRGFATSVLQEIVRIQLASATASAMSGMGGVAGSVIGAGLAAAFGGGVSSTGTYTAYNVPGKADGGYIKPNGDVVGPGSDTSDSVDSVVPAGSYVLRAAAVRAYGRAELERLLASGKHHAVKLSRGEKVVEPGRVNKLGLRLLDRINNADRYADGGLVGRAAARVQRDVARSGDINVNVPVTVQGGNSIDEERADRMARRIESSTRQIVREEINMAHGPRGALSKTLQKIR